MVNRALARRIGEQHPVKPVARKDISVFRIFICSLTVTVVGLLGVLCAEARGQALLPPVKDPKPGVSYHIEALVSGWSLLVQGFAVKDNANI
jgi:hypothetical protein